LKAPTAAGRLYVIFKRLADIVVSAALLVLLSPFMLLCMIAVKIESPGPAVYRSERVGRGGRAFSLFKIRTMYQNSPRGFVVNNDPRVTWLGRLLRNTSLDELPQLYNVLRGDMSLVGPRPDISGNYINYDDRTMRRLEVRPGITGLAQVKGRNRIPWAKRYAYDVQYVEHVSLRLDVSIMLQTVRSVLRRRDINVGG
jgi:lipopolysaccharide/colanic/teichoic acid biosynthesis glycosyltransferase